MTIMEKNRRGLSRLKKQKLVQRNVSREQVKIQILKEYKNTDVYTLRE